jgi:hypothetical protein
MYILPLFVRGQKWKHPPPAPVLNKGGVHFQKNKNPGG